MYNTIYQSLTQQKAKWQNEEEVRQAWIIALTKATGLTFNAERERKDSSYNNVIIEFKSKGLFNGSTVSPKFLEARDGRLKKYILKTSKQEGGNESDYIGIGIDGEHIFFAQVINGEIITGPLLPFSETTFEMVVTACNDAFRRAVTSSNLIEDFGLGSVIGTDLMRAFISKISNKIIASEDSKERMLFEEWRTLYGQIADLAIDQVDKIEATLCFTSTAQKELRIPSSLFVIHTFNSLLIKLLAAEIISTHGLTSYPYFSQHALSLSDDDLLNTIKTDIENGELFSRANINGFVEEAIFSWYSDACEDAIFKKELVLLLRSLFAKIALYRTDNLDIARSKDVLKQLYQNLVPDQLRKSLGEFYTPDWLVDVTLDKVEPKTWLTTRVLDPTCGSGSFLLEVIRRKRIASKKAGISDIDQLRDLTQNVWGFDLNPLAVQTARVNFLIAISDLLKSLPGHEIELPILLADAVYSPAPDPMDGEKIVRYKIGSNIADLEIVLPSPLAFDRIRLDTTFSYMQDCIETNKEFAEIEKGFLANKIISSDELADWRPSLKETYDRVLALHRKNWNGIWFRIVRNFFWSSTAKQFDIVTGNPPWVRWSKLPELYRERAKPTCMQYDIFSSTPHHGGNELDISAMITYTVADKWLKPDGLLGFVITQTLFQTPSSAGFRRFNLNEQYSLIPIEIDDLTALTPFPGIANRTAIAIFKKLSKQIVKYPLPYTLWSNRKPFTKVIPENSLKSSVLLRVDTIKMEANPVGGIGSPWAILPKGRFKQLAKLKGKCNWVQGRKGITADLNGLYFVDIINENKSLNRVEITTRPEAGKTEIGPKQSFWIEPDFIFPLLKGSSDFIACRIQRAHTLYVLIPNNGILKADYELSDQLLKQSLPKTLKYFKTFENILSSRSTFRQRQSKAPFYVVYNVGKYTFAPYKVIWAEQGNFRAAVLTSDLVPTLGLRPFVPDHKIFFADFNEPKAAYYLCGLLNADAIKEYIESHNISIQIGDIFKHMSLPVFDSSNALHVELYKSTELAHTCEASLYDDALINVKQIAKRILGL